jgi:hypothetical protein
MCYRDFCTTIGFPKYYSMYFIEMGELGKDFAQKTPK